MKLNFNPCICNSMSFVIIKKGEIVELTHVDSRARALRLHLALGWSQARWIVFGSSRLGEGVLQEDFGLCFVCVCPYLCLNQESFI